MDLEKHNCVEEEESSVADDTAIYVRVSIPQQDVQKILKVDLFDTIWNAKIQLLSMLPKDVKNKLNFGFFLPAENGRTGKFLDESRQFFEYPIKSKLPFLEFKYKRRVYKSMSTGSKMRRNYEKREIKRFFELVRNNQVEKIAKHLANGFDPNIQCHRTGETPLTLAVTLSSPRDMIISLYEGGAHLDFRCINGFTPLHRAAIVGKAEAIKAILELGGSANVRDAKNLVPLYYTVLSKATTICLEALLYDHSVVCCYDDKGWTELHHACKLGLAHHVEHLLYYGANPNCRNQAGNTPLHISTAYNQLPCVKILLYRGATENAKNCANQTALDIATLANFTKIIDTLKNHDSSKAVPFCDPPILNKKRRNNVYGSRGNLLSYRTESAVSESSLCFTRLCEDGSNSLCSSVSNKCEIETGESVSYVCPKIRLYPAIPGRTGICCKAYRAEHPWELSLEVGDFVEIISVGDNGFYEGKCGDKEGWFDSECIEDIKLDRGKFVDNSFGPVVVDKYFLSSILSRSCNDPVKTVVLQKKKKGFGMLISESQSSHWNETLPSCNFISHVEERSSASKAGLKIGDFVIEINGINATCLDKDDCQKMIKRTGDMLTLKVISVPKSNHDGQTNNFNKDHGYARSLPSKRKPLIPMRSLNTIMTYTPSLCDLKPNILKEVCSHNFELQEIDELDRALEEFDIESNSFNDVRASASFASSYSNTEKRSYYVETYNDSHIDCDNNDTISTFSEFINCDGLNSDLKLRKGVSLSLTSFLSSASEKVNDESCANNMFQNGHAVTFSDERLQKSSGCTSTRSVFIDEDDSKYVPAKIPTTQQCHVTNTLGSERGGAMPSSIVTAQLPASNIRSLAFSDDSPNSYYSCNSTVIENAIVSGNGNFPPPPETFFCNSAKSNGSAFECSYKHMSPIGLNGVEDGTICKKDKCPINPCDTTESCTKITNKTKDTNGSGETTKLKFDFRNYNQEISFIRRANEVLCSLRRRKASKELHLAYAHLD